MKNIINQMIANNEFKSSPAFYSALSNKEYEVKYSVVKDKKPHLMKNDTYWISCCFFFYKKGYLFESFMCEISGTSIDLIDKKINCFPYQCNDVNRSSDWEWVDVNFTSALPHR